MNKVKQLVTWSLKAWPLLSVGIIAFVHYYLYRYIGTSINKFIALFLQFIGGLVVLYSINDNIGTFKRRNLFSIFVEWLKSFPLIKKATTVGKELDLRFSIEPSSIYHAERKCETVDEKLEEFKRQLDELRNLVFLKEIAIRNDISTIEIKFQDAISKNNADIRDVKKLLDDSIVGAVNLQLFGVLLVSYGAFLNLI
jgi:hypothetical protein